MRVLEAGITDQWRRSAPVQVPPQENDGVATGSGGAIRDPRRGVKRRAPRRLVLDEYVPALLTWIANSLSNTGSQTYRKWLDLGITDWRVLAYLGVYETGTAAQICKLIGLDKAATSRSIAVLKERGFLSTEQLKGRAVDLKITKPGRTTYEDMLSVAFERETALLIGFSGADKVALTGLLHRLLANLDRVGAVRPIVT